jgi:glycosyltransferase involved in cell wall biosynthesis
MKNLVVIPAYNEEDAIVRTLQDLQSLPDGFELLVINDGSLDRTEPLAEAFARTSRLPVHVVSLPTNCGIGAAMQTGYLFAAARDNFDYVIQFDGDGQHDAACIPRLIDACEAGDLDLCVGSRFLGQGDAGFRSTFLRRLGIRFFAGLIGLLARTRVTDPTSGFRCAGRRAWTAFARHYPEDYPEPESLFWCVRNGLRIGEIPVRMRTRQGGTSSIRRLRSVYYMLKVSLAILIDRLRRVEFADR